MYFVPKKVGVVLNGVNLRPQPYPNPANSNVGVPKTNKNYCLLIYDNEATVEPAQRSNPISDQIRTMLRRRKGEMLYPNCAEEEEEKCNGVGAPLATAKKNETRFYVPRQSSRPRL